MTIREMIRQGFHSARTCKSLWLFGFVIGVTSGGSSGGGTGSGGDSAGGAAAAAAAAAAGAGALGLRPAVVVPIIIVLLVVAAAALVMRFVSEGALIEGVARARQGGTMTMRDGFGAGWTHWGVVMRIALTYVGATIASLIVLIVPCVVVLRAAGPVGGVLVGVPTVIIAVPWLITLYLIQAFAVRIAVLEHRHAFDALRKARLFLHGRVKHGLKLIVATLAGTVVLVALALAAVVPLVLLLRVLPVIPIIVIGSVLILPVMCVLAAMVGTLRSSIWTIGYLTEVES